MIKNGQVNQVISLPDNNMSSVEEETDSDLLEFQLCRVVLTLCYKGDSESDQGDLDSTLSDSSGQDHYIIYKEYVSPSEIFNLEGDVGQQFSTLDSEFESELQHRCFPDDGITGYDTDNREAVFQMFMNHIGSNDYSFTSSDE